MDQLFQSSALWFSIPALVGSMVFLLRLGLMFLGGGSADFDLEIEEGGDSSSAFELLSFQTLFAFLMGFGWSGLAAYLGMQWSVALSTLTGIGGGLFLVWLLALMFNAVFSLQSSGNLRLEDAIGLEAEVYAPIPAHRQGRGQVLLVLHNRQRVCNAVSQSASIAKGERVQILRIQEDRTLLVAPF